jgi:hypothetical protein
MLRIFLHFFLFNNRLKHSHTFSVKFSVIFLPIRNHWGDPDVDGRIILRWIFRKWEGVVGTGWSWLRIGTGGGHL